MCCRPNVDDVTKQRLRVRPKVVRLGMPLCKLFFFPCKTHQDDNRAADSSSPVRANVGADPGIEILVGDDTTIVTEAEYDHIRSFCPWKVHEADWGKQFDAPAANEALVIETVSANWVHVVEPLTINFKLLRTCIKQHIDRGSKCQRNRVLVLVNIFSLHP